MTTNGIDGGIGMGGVAAMQPGSAGQMSPAGVLSKLITLLREARQTQRETETMHSDAGLKAAMDRAQHAREKAEASKRQAFFNFGMQMTGSLMQMGTNVTGAIAANASERSKEFETQNGSVSPDLQSEMFGAQRADRIMRGFNDGNNALMNAAQGLDDLYGNGEEIRDLEVKMEEDSARQDIHNAHQDRVGNRIADIEDALADARQAYKEIVTSKEGGE